jgi:hypothetical protein
MTYEFQPTAVRELPLPVLRNRVEEALGKLAEALRKPEESIWEIAVNATKFPPMFEDAPEEAACFWHLLEELRDAEAIQVKRLVSKNHSV